MSARRAAPGAGGRVTELRHTRPRRGLLRRRRLAPPAAHWPAPGREVAAASSCRGPAGPPGGRGLGARGGAGRALPGRVGSAAASERRQQRGGHLVCSAPAPRWGGRRGSATWIASLGALVRPVLCHLGVLFNPGLNDQKLEFRGFPTVRRSPSAGLAVNSWQFSLGL